MVIVVVVVFILGLVIIVVMSWFGKLFEFKWMVWVWGWCKVGVVIVCWFGFILVGVVVLVFVGLLILLGYWINYNDCNYLFVDLLVNEGYVVVECYFF